MRIPKLFFPAPDSWLNSNSGSVVNNEEDKSEVINYSPEVGNRVGSPLLIDMKGPQSFISSPMNY